MTTSLQHNSRQNFFALFSAVASGQGEIKKRDFVNFGYYFFLCLFNTATHFWTLFCFLISNSLSLSVCAPTLSHLQLENTNKKKELEQRHL